MASRLIEIANSYNWWQIVYNGLWSMPYKGRRYTTCDSKPNLHAIIQGNNLMQWNVLGTFNNFTNRLVENKCKVRWPKLRFKRM
jgi:hypothetical protein